MNKETFKIELEKINISINEDKIKKLDVYLKTLIEYNKHTNLTAIKTEEDIYLKHFYDSLTIAKYIENEENILDIGTGAGFPGMVLAIFFPNSNFTLLDSNNKKTKFLKYLKEKLNISNVQIINSRAEDFVRNNFEKFDVVTSRAVADLKILLELSLPALKIKGKFIPMKSKLDEELQGIELYLNELKGQIIKVDEFYLPIENSKRTILVIEHTEKTNMVYPRTYDKILKKPLKKTT